MFFQKKEELMLKPELEKWVERLEKEVSKLNDKNIDRWEIANKIFNKLEDENYYDLIGQIFNSFNATQNREYFGLFERFCNALNAIGKGEEAFMKYTDHQAYQFFFGAKKECAYKVMREVTEYIEFDGKKYTIEEYMDLARKVNTLNNSLLGYTIWCGGIKGNNKMTPKQKETFLYFGLND